MSSTDEDKSAVPTQYVDVVTREILDKATAQRLFAEYSAGAPKKLRYRCDLVHRMPGLCGEYGLVNLKYRAVRTTHASLHCQKQGSRAGFNTPGKFKRLPHNTKAAVPQDVLRSWAAAVACYDCSSDDGAKPPAPDEQGEQAEKWGSGWKKQKLWTPQGYEAVSLTPPESSASTSPHRSTASELSNHAGDSHLSSGSGEAPSDSAASNKRPCPSVPSQSPPLEGAKQDKEEEGKPAKEESELPPTSEERWKGACFYSLSDALHAALLTMPHCGGNLKSIYEVLVRMRPLRIVTSYEKAVNRDMSNGLVSSEAVIDITGSHNWKANIRTTFTRHKARFDHIPNSYGVYQLTPAAARQVPPVIQAVPVPSRLPAPAPTAPSSSTAAPGPAPDTEAPPCAEDAAPAPKAASAEGKQLPSKQKQEAPAADPISKLGPDTVPTVVPDVVPAVVPEVVPGGVLDLDPAFQDTALSQMDIETLQRMIGLEALSSPVSVPPATDASLTALQTLLASQPCSVSTAAPISPALESPPVGFSVPAQSSLDLWPLREAEVTTAAPLACSNASLEQLIAAHRGASEQLRAAQMLQQQTQQAIHQELQAQAAWCSQELEDLDLPLLDLGILPADSPAQPPLAEAPPAPGLGGPGLTQAIMQGALTQLGMGAMQCFANGLYIFTNGRSAAEPDNMMEDTFYMRRLLTEHEPKAGSQLLQAILSLLDGTAFQGQVPEEPLPAHEHQMDFGLFTVRLDVFYIIFILQMCLVALISLMALGFDVGLASPKWELKVPSVAAQVQRLQQWGEAQCKRLLCAPGGASDLTSVIQVYAVVMASMCYVSLSLGSLPNFGWALKQLPMQGKASAPHATLLLVTVLCLSKLKNQPKWQAWVAANPYTMSTTMSFTASISRCICVDVLSWVESPIVRIGMPALFCLLILASCSCNRTRDEMKYSVMIMVLSGVITSLWRAYMHVGCWGYDGQQRDEVVLETAMSVVLPLAVLYSHPTTITSAQASTAA